jgi:hypothetical protein
MTTYFISGHLDLTQEEFVEHYTGPLVRAIEEEATFVVGDAKGCDSMAQAFLRAQQYGRVIVYHMFDMPRNNAGFPTKGGFISDSARDRSMTEHSDKDIAWVRSGRDKSGTARNIARRKHFPKRDCHAIH